MPALIAALGSLITQFFGNSLVRWLAMKAILTTLTVVVLPVVLKNVIGWFLDASWTHLQQKLATLPGISSLPSLTYQFTGLAGYFASHLRVVDCVSVLLTGLLINVSLRFVNVGGN